MMVLILNKTAEMAPDWRIRCAVLLAVVCSHGFADEPLQSIAHFTMRDDQDGSGAVTVVVGDYSCTFEFSSRAASEKELVPSEAVKVAAKMVDLQKTLPCVKSATVGNSVFEVCPGDFVRQITSGVSIQLGLYETKVANHEYYANGELCSSVHPVIPRTARVSYSCGQAIGVRSVTETSTCAYEIEVSVPSVCGIKEFDQDVGISQAADVHYDRPWMLEIEEYGNGEVACAASSVDDLKIGGFQYASLSSAADVALNTLNWFALSVKRTDDYAVGKSRSTHSKPLELVRQVVRGYNRVPFPPAFIDAHVPAGPAVPVVISTIPSFTGGKVEFVSLTVKDPEPEYESGVV